MRSAAWILLMILIPAGAFWAPGQAPEPVSVGSGFPHITRSDRALARISEAERTGHFQAAREEALAVLREAQRGDAEMDSALIASCRFIHESAEVREALLDACDADQLARIVIQLERKDFRSQRILADEFVKRYPAHPGAADIGFYAARAHMVVDAYDKVAITRWEELAAEHKGTPAARRAEVFLEAMRGPQSIAALEAAHEIASLQKDVEGYLRATLSNMRVVEAAKRPFFEEFMESPSITRNEKAEIFYIILVNSHQAGLFSDVEPLARRILALNPENRRLRDRASFAIPMSWFMQSENERAAEGFEQYIKEWPLGEDTDRAILYRAQALYTLGKIADAYIELQVLLELYPNSPAEWITHP